MKTLLRVEIKEKLTKKQFFGPKNNFCCFFWRFWNLKTEFFCHFWFSIKKKFFVIEMRYYSQKKILRHIESTQRKLFKKVDPPHTHTERQCGGGRGAWNLTLDLVGQIPFLVCDFFSVWVAVSNITNLILSSLQIHATVLFFL